MEDRMITLSFDGPTDVVSTVFYFGKTNKDDVLAVMRQHYGLFLVDDNATIHRFDESFDFMNGQRVLTVTVYGYYGNRSYTISCTITDPA